MGATELAVAMDTGGLELLPSRYRAPVANGPVPPDSRRRTLDAVFDPRRNGLNLVRLFLAVGVIVWHSFPLSGHSIAGWPLRQLLSEVFLDGFFAISGFLILSSWMRRPELWPYVWARALRIMPAFLTCLFVVAAFLAPLGILLSGQRLPNDYEPEAIFYVVKNSGLRILQTDIAGTPAQVPYPASWNGSLWTLWWEFLCYLAVAAAGVIGFLRRRWVLPFAFLAMLLICTAATYGLAIDYRLTTAARFGLMFAAGALIYQYRSKLPVSRSLMGVAGAVIALSSGLTDYRLVSAIPLAYILLTSGALLKDPRARFSNDLSYGTYIYAFPVQQVLASAGLFLSNVVVFAIASIILTLPLAAASWFLVERPALRLKTHGRAPQTIQQRAAEG